MKPSAQITTITFFNFSGGDRWWMLGQMGRRSGLNGTTGLSFYKFMGSGGENGFSVWPDFSTYVLLAVWDEEKHANGFFQSHQTFQNIIQHSEDYWTVFLQNIKAHGKWSGGEPFKSATDQSKGLHVVLTRATINPIHVVHFWRHVPSVSKDHQGRKGLIYSKGIGEFPVFMQATVSFWESREAMVQYAYKSRLHAGVIEKARKLGWYAEELFANFKLYKVIGNRSNPLAQFL